MSDATIQEWGDRHFGVFNPHSKPLDELPTIYGFNNGGSPGWYSAVLIADDGEVLGSHVCSHEGYMPGDLGVLAGYRTDRHTTFREHYPDGYRMDFVSSDELPTHVGLNAAIKRNEAKALTEEGAPA
jgi:hypothetical protein